MTHPAANWPRLTLADAHARLTAPGSPFELADAVVRGVPMRVWKHVPATAAAVFARARGHGAREFLVLEEERVSFDAFARAVLALAAALRRRGLRKGERVALAARNLPEWPVVLMAVLLAGGVAVPLNAWWTGAELAFGLADSGARFLFADGERLARLEGLLPPSVETVFGLRAAGAVPLADLIGPPAAWASLPEGALPDVVLDPEDDATIFYTSGTTGAPKGALGTHRSLTTNIFAAPFVLARAALRRGEPPPDPARAPQRVTLLAIPFFHVTACLSSLIPNMAAGGKLVLMPKFDPENALALIAREKVTVTGGVPAVVLALLDHIGDHDVSSLGLLNYGGAPAPADLAARVRARLGAAPGQGWGMTETSATCTSHFAEEYEARPESCGPALPVSRIKVTDAAGRTLPPGEAGELWAFGPNIVKGYWNRPRETAAAFAEGWVRTGDIARMDEDGLCTILDRVHDMLIRGGENIYCAEVEHVLTQHPGVADAALVGLPHPHLGEVPAALVQVRAGADLCAETLRAFAGARLAAFKVPERILLSAAPLPRNAGGKLVKDAIRKAFAP
jgi:long-chain acyl-CoA synthetase